MQIRVLLLSTLLAAVLTGCSTTPPEASSPGTIAPPDSVPTAPPPKPRKPAPAPQAKAPAPEALPDIPAPRTPSDSGGGNEATASEGELVGRGLASWYGPGLHGRRTANGERFDRYEFTAAHRTLPFGTRLCVRSAVTGKAVVVRINDRGPFAKGRVIDLSQAAAQELGMAGLGIKPVELRRLEATDDACPGSVGDDGEASPAPRHRPRAKAKPKPRKKRR
ncbi:MAG: septal ring lytic transglycosylase RlpA family protein [Acidovorax sp.]